MKKAVVFDLDGTLADSLESIAYCVNRALQKYEFEALPKENYRYYAGDGAAKLVERALKAAGDTELTAYNKVYEAYLEYFKTDCMYHVRPYEGIEELLKQLKEKGLRTAVLSNKPQHRTEYCISEMFGKNTFDIVLGASDRFERKPSPEGVLYISRQLGIDTCDMLYLGDTNTDMKTGKAAGAYTVGALWGFRDRKELEENHADAVIVQPLELLDYITE